LKIYADYISLFIFEKSISLDLRIVFECHFSSCFSVLFTITLLKNKYVSRKIDFVTVAF